ncbi:MAG TPA: hypothetical protein VHB46_01890 [Burkholderiales bacterium]|nr:hypothetical protein [Burkholderiales bacterium]
MSLPATVRKPQALPLGLDHAPMFELGMRQVRAYSRELWSDHNIHDPGITALEQLCYAINELCYRAFHPIEDLLASPEDNPENMLRQFAVSRRALTNRPLTELDCRKLMIDVPGVRNAWIVSGDQALFADPVAGELLATDPGLPGVREIHLGGLYRALVEFADADAPPATRTAILAHVSETLQANRNLCQDFTAVEAIELQEFILCAEIEIEPGADASQVHARILVVVQGHLRPGVPRHDRDTMIARHRPADPTYGDPDLFEGPALAGGFIDEAELAAAGLRETIRLSDLINLIMDVEGVRAIRNVILRPADVATPPDAMPPKWEIAVDPLKRATLATQRCRLVFYKGSMPVPSSGAIAEYASLWALAEAAFLPCQPGDAPIPLGRFRHPSDYQSVQKHFPAVYGIGDAGLPTEADAQRRAQARQLQGYLLGFDQLMADYCAQLEHARLLFGLDPDLGNTYACQGVESMRDFREFYPPPTGAAQQARESGDDGAALDAWRERVRAYLQRAAESPEGMLARRNRFLDHLIARYSERLQDYVSVSDSVYGVTPASAVRAKCAFLQAYPEMNAERCRAFDYTLAPAGGADTNVSGLQKRLTHLLGLGGLLIEIYQERDDDGIDEFRFRVLRRAADGVLLSSTRHYATPELALQALGLALEAGELPARYDRQVAIDGTHYFDILDAAGNELARRIQYFRTPELMEAAIAELQTEIAEHHRERICIVEAILLRPQAADDPLLPICAGTDCGDDCAGDDPYSCRLHVILPAGSRLFRQMAFRGFAERVIRDETPAHLLPRICWVAEEDMARIEAAWLAWRAVLAGSDVTDRAGKLKALRDALYSARNVYPAAVLADCSEPEKFILGRSALGSQEQEP